MSFTLRPPRALLLVALVPAVMIRPARAERTNDTPPAYAWTCVTRKARFAPRDGAGALVFRERMWLIGGWNPRDPRNFPRECNNEVWSSADGALWRLEKANTFLSGAFDPRADWEGRHTAGYAIHRDRMWIIGGDPLQGHYQNDVWSSDDGRAWRLETGDVPWGPRVLHYTVAFDGRLWVMGGQTLPQFAPAPERFLADVWSSADGVTWTEHEVIPPAWSPRGMIGGAAVHRGRMWILGGGAYDTPGRPDRSFHNDVWSSADGARWTRHLEHAPWPARQYHDVAVFDDRLWVMEGWNPDGGNRNDVWHSADGETWHELPDTPWPPRHAASLFVHNDSLWVVAGNNLTSDVWRLRRLSPPD